MSSILTAFLVILLLILVTGLLSLSEFAQVASRRWRLRERAARGDRGAGAALRLSEDPDRFVRTVRLGMTMAATLAGLYAGVTLGRFLEDRAAGGRHTHSLNELILVGERRGSGSPWSRCSWANSCPGGSPSTGRSRSPRGSPGR